MTKRETAMKWWNEQDSAYKQKLYKQYERGYEFTPANNWAGLTGREIERIYELKQ